jgi:hypothetical protein
MRYQAGGRRWGARHEPARAMLTAGLRLPGILGVATGDGAAWVTTGNAVLRIDSCRPGPAGAVRSERVADRHRLRGWQPVGGIPRWHPAAGSGHRQGHGPDRGACRIARLRRGALWALGSIGGAGSLARIDPRTNAVRSFPLTPGKTWDLAAGEGAVWISVAMPLSAGVLRVNPATGRVTARISGDHLFGQVAAGDGAVWASDGAAVSRIDPRTGRVTATTPLLSPLPVSGESPVLNGSGLLAVAPGVVWVTRAPGTRHASVLRIGPRTGHLTGALLPVGREPQAAASGTTLWVVTAQGLTRIDLVTCAHGRCRRPAPPASLPAAPAPVWLDSLQMISAADGWALAWTKSPAAPDTLSRSPRRKISS